MKIHFSIVPLIVLVAFLFINPLNTKAQLPGLGISFQAIARDKMDNPAKDRKIYVQTSILQNTNSTNSIYTEIHQSTTDVSGIFHISIGQGNRISGTANNLLSIPWYNGPLVLNLKIAIEPLTPLSNWDYTKEWIDLGTSPFGTVPYALYAGNSTNNDQKLNISDTASMLSPYAKSILSFKNVDTSSLSTRINSKLNMNDTSILLSPYSKQLQVNNALALKLNIADTALMMSSRITRDTVSLSNRIDSRLLISDTSNLLSPYTKQTQINQLLALKLNIVDTALMMSSRIARDTISLSNRINTKLNFSDTAYMLRNYALSSNLSPLAYTANYNDLLNKPAVIANIVNTVNGLTGDVLINKNTIGIANVDNTTDANKPISILTNTALNNKVDKTAINAANGIPSLDANTKIPSYLLPAISFTSVTIANSSAQMQSIGATALKGTVAVRTDISRTYVLSVDNSSNVNDWVEILNPGAPVQSVNGKLANINLTTSDISEGTNEYFTQSKARLSLSANGPINYNAVSGLLSADTSTSNYSLVTRYTLQEQNNTTNANLNSKVNLSDTSNMLYPYVRNASNTAVLLTKVNVADTAIMLSNRITRDTIALSNRINDKLNLADTASMLLNYKNNLVSLTTNKLNISDTALMLASRIQRDTLSLSNRINLKETTANKSTDINLDAASIVKFPTTGAVKRYVDSVAIILNTNIVASNNAIVLPDASASTKGIVQLAGDLSGNATTPIIANNAINTVKIIDGAITTAKVFDAAITDSKIASEINPSKVGLGNVDNTSDLNKPISTLTQNALNAKLNTSDTATMLGNYLTNMHTTKNALDTKLNKNDTAAMLGNYLTNMHTAKNALDTKLNKTDTATMLSNYLTNMHTTKNALDTKLNKTDTATMLNNYLTNMHTTKNALDTKLNKNDTAAMLSNYLTNMHTTKNVLDTKELTANKSNDATLGGGSPSATLYPTQSAVKQYITNNAGSGSISATSITGVVPIANGGSGQTTANAAFNAFAPSQTSNSGKYLTTDGTNASWASVTTPWGILGNTGMVDGTNFIGTTDAQPLNFKVNNTNAGRIDVSDVIGQTSFGYGAAPSTAKNLNSLNGLKNTAIGYQSLNRTYNGKENTAIGYQALVNETSGSGSIAIGHQAMTNQNNNNPYGSIQSYNLGIGYQVMQGSTTMANNTGTYNIAMGYQTFFKNAGGNYNVAVGTQALYFNASGNYNAAFGSNALISNIAGHYNAAFGTNSLRSNTGTGNTAIGYQAGYTTTSGTYNTFVGYGADANGAYTNATAIGNGAAVIANNTIVLGNSAIVSLTTAGAMVTTNATASTSSSTGALVVAGGAGIGGNVNIAGTTTILGTTTLNSIAYGTTPSANDNSTKIATTAYVVNAIAGISTSTSGTSGWALTGNSGMVDGTNFIGTTDAQPLNFVANNINAGRIDVVALSGQTSIGYGAAATTLKNTSNLYGTKNTAIGFQTLTNTVYGKENTALGYQALYHNNTASGSTAIGYQAMFNAYNLNTASQYNTYNTAVGYQALLGSSTQANNNGRSNTALGHQTLRSNSSGSNNSALGYLALYMNSTGQGNTGLGYNSLYGNTTGQYNTAVGYGLVNNDIGSYNTAIGYNTLSSNASGNYNTGIGYNTEISGNVSNSTVIGNGATTAVANTIQLGNGSVTNVNTSGSITAGEDVSLKHVKGTTAKPTVTFYGVNVGVTDLVISGTDLGGFIQFTTRASTSKDIGIFSINFAKVYTTSPFVVLTAANAAASTLPVYVNANSSFFYVFPSTVTPTPNTMYSWYYMVVQ
jgi:hypothetical protein